MPAITVIPPRHVELVASSGSKSPRGRASHPEHHWTFQRTRRSRTHIVVAGRMSLFDSGDGAALLHLLHAGVTCAAVLGLKLYRSSRQRSAAAAPKQAPADEQLQAAREELAAKEEQLRQLRQLVAQQRFTQEQSEELSELRGRLKSAQEELLSAGQRCREASERMARTA
ncbi:hypothetical protein PLESTB_001599400 [Pleodorina starrii]|uniref:Uncharacterized protein n=1 Tax=Pleodorina starrii TaxID=330485 RepID=A0A9W6BXZ1_9CHLO|nr:hypothetical protein PLESTB_001599400 [Pleodorina starrii]